MIRSRENRFEYCKPKYYVDYKALWFKAESTRYVSDANNQNKILHTQLFGKKKVKPIRIQSDVIEPFVPVARRR